MSVVQQHYESEIVMPPFVVKRYNSKFNTEGLTRTQAYYTSNIIVTPNVLNRYSFNFEALTPTIKRFNSEITTKNLVQQSFIGKYFNTGRSWKSTLTFSGS